MIRWAFLLFTLGTLAFGQNAPVTSMTLNNGMKVLIQEDHAIPSVALYFFYKVGSRNERERWRHSMRGVKAWVCS